MESHRRSQGQGGVKEALSAPAVFRSLRRRVALGRPCSAHRGQGLVLLLQLVVGRGERLLSGVQLVVSLLQLLLESAQLLLGLRGAGETPRGTGQVRRAALSARRRLELTDVSALSFSSRLAWAPCSASCAMSKSFSRVPSLRWMLRSSSSAYSCS